MPNLLNSISELEENGQEITFGNNRRLKLIELNKDSTFEIMMRDKSQTDYEKVHNNRFNVMHKTSQTCYEKVDNNGNCFKINNDFRTKGDNHSKGEAMLLQYTSPVMTKSNVNTTRDEKRIQILRDALARSGINCNSIVCTTVPFRSTSSKGDNVNVTSSKERINHTEDGEVIKFKQCLVVDPGNRLNQFDAQNKQMKWPQFKNCEKKVINPARIKTFHRQRESVAIKEKFKFCLNEILMSHKI